MVTMTFYAFITHSYFAIYSSTVHLNLFLSMCHTTLAMEYQLIFFSIFYLTFKGIWTLSLTWFFLISTPTLSWFRNLLHFFLMRQLQSCWPLWIDIFLLHILKYLNLSHFILITVDHPTESICRFKSKRIFKFPSKIIRVVLWLALRHFTNLRLWVV